MYLKFKFNCVPVLLFAQFSNPTAELPAMLEMVIVPFDKRDKKSQSTHFFLILQVLLHPSSPPFSP